MAKNPYIKFIERQISADIEAAKRGALDEITLRERLEASVSEDGADSPFSILCLWLLALIDGVIDDLEVQVKDGQKAPKLLFKPVFSSGSAAAKVPVIELPIPGPFDHTNQDTQKNNAALPG